jgi:hypothetical protein
MVLKETGKPAIPGFEGIVEVKEVRCPEANKLLADETAHWQVLSCGLVAEWIDGHSNQNPAKQSYVHKSFRYIMARFSTEAVEYARTNGRYQ